MFYKEEIKKCLDDMKDIKTFYKQIPNLLTCSRAVCGPIISLLFLTGHPLIGLLSTMLLFLTDAIDGNLARKWGVVSKFGADLDAFCDKIMFLGLSIPLLAANPMVLLNFVLEGVISLINVIGRVNGIDTKTVFSGKVKTCLLSIMLGVGYLVQYLNVSVILLNIMVILTSLSQGVAIIDYVKEYKRMMDKKDKLDILSLNIEESNEKDEVLIKNNSLIDELKHERELLLESQNTKVENKTLVRKRILNRKKNNY